MSLLILLCQQLIMTFRTI